MAHTTIDHPPVFTVAEAKALRGTLPGGNCKCLFLKNKKQRMWLLVLPENLRLDLEKTAGALGSKRLSFASPERLRSVLGVTPGAVTPFAVINDQPARVTVVVAQELLEHEVLNFHPLVNDRTTSIATGDFIRFLETTGHLPAVLAAADIAAG
ncbi:MAG: prolyl-tRNA synthetase associated domain-containing protein [Acidimicrobiia bacterium]|nr:prolyl-tRNA synthetase associated domain-containing protein [Acidimicrobiia bacterium]